MDGVDAVRAALDAGVRSRRSACSSAGGGLRLAVVGYERLVTAEAGFRVGLSAGARVVHVAAGPCRPTTCDELVARDRTWCCSSAAPTAATPRCCCTTPRRSPADRSACRGRRRQRRGTRRGGRSPVVGRHIAVTATANVLPEHRAARPAAGAGGHPRGLHPARDRRQGPLVAGRTSRRWCAPRHPTRCSPASRCSPTAPTRCRVPATCWSSTSVARPPTSTPS